MGYEFNWEIYFLSFYEMKMMYFEFSSCLWMNLWLWFYVRTGMWKLFAACSQCSLLYFAQSTYLSINRTQTSIWQDNLDLFIDERKEKLISFAVDNRRKLPLTGWGICKQCPLMFPPFIVIKNILWILNCQSMRIIHWDNYTSENIYI